MADYMNYINKIPGILEQYFNPWIQQGQEFMQHPGENVNRIGQGFQQSPGFQFAMQQALQGGRHAAAAGGMAGTPQSEQQAMEMATQLANQEYGNWMDRALGVQKMGYAGGQQAGLGLGENIANVMGTKAQYGYAEEEAKRRRDAEWWQNLFGGVGAAAGAIGKAFLI